MENAFFQGVGISLMPGAAQTAGTHRFTGKERDAETGLDYFGARYLSGLPGRFTGADAPFADQEETQPQSWNLYAYVRNNPLRFIYLTGRECIRTNNGWADDGSGGGCEKAEVDANGNITPQKVTVRVGRNEASLIMLQMIGEQLSSGHQWADLTSKAGQAAGTVLAPGSTGMAQCVAGGITGNGCDKSSVALAVAPYRPGVPTTAVSRFAKNPRLRNISAAFNRTCIGIGTGNTAGAIRYELETGRAVGGKLHYAKGVELRNGLLKLWRNPNLDPSDKAIVKELLIDLQEALSRK
ncbi:MAG: RHS repeat-associated core domain-containing protein [Bryobacterales bacterium]|nr:RHS repeat-associated core domain-containing protein [Bryobacterales bacterium]